MARPSAEKTVSKETKNEISEKILAGELTIDQARKQLSAPSYQVAAWVGLYVEAKVQQGFRLLRPGAAPSITVTPSNDDAPFTDTGVLKPMTVLTPEQMAVVESYVLNLMRRSS